MNKFYRIHTISKDWGIIMFEQVFDEKEVLDYIADEKEINLFIYGDIMNFGLKNKICRVYLNKIKNRIDSLILVYQEKNIVFYSKYNDFDVDEIISFLQKTNFSVISGKENLINRFLNKLDGYELESTYMTRYNLNKDNSKLDSNDSSVRMLTTKEDFTKAFNLLKTIKEFEGSNTSTLEEYISDSIEGLNNGTHKYGYFINASLIAMGGTTAENKISSMIFAVCCDKNYRNKGYATKVINYICMDATRKKQEFLCLFYNNPLAAKIYHKVGFVDLEKYGMIKKITK